MWIAFVVRLGKVGSVTESAALVFAVDDDESFLKVLSYQIRALGFRVEAFLDPAQALERMEGGTHPDVVVTDLRMPEMDGMELLQRILAFDEGIAVIVLTAHGTIEAAVEATKRGAFAFLTKPYEQAELDQAIRNALKLSSLQQENRRLSEAIQERFRFDGIVGASPSFRQVLRLAEQLAAVETTALILGESGTGKELVARAIHFNSPRKKRPFITLNCAAIPENLMEAELFGYKKGAFTGATTDRKGKFEAAQGGSIFLDEIGELSPALQAKLLRVLQEREIDVVGDPVPRPVDVRVIAASNRDLWKMVEEKKFREDLYFRLAVAPIHLPPLRERREDIPILAQSFLDRFAEKYGKKVKFTAEVMEALQNYTWPGNVRELENVVERMVIFAKRERLSWRDLPSEVRQYRVRSLAGVVVHLPEGGFSLEDLERDILRAALEMHEWNQTKTAKYLRITRNTLIYRMQKYRLRPEGILT
ncbi:MAG: sigma-54 dependent transcriptional regulator [Acidobacteriota bacterium]